MATETTEEGDVENGDISQLDQENIHDYDPEVYNLYKLFVNQYRKQYINYQKWYYVSDEYRKVGDFFTNIELFLGVLLLLLFGGLIAQLEDIGTITEAEVANILILATILSAIVVAFPIMKARHEWSIKAERYHRYGQIHQRLFYDIEYRILTRFANEEVGTKEVKKDYRRIMKRKSELNQASPTLDSRMYEDLIENIEIDVADEMEDFQLIIKSRSEEGYEKSVSTISSSTTRIENLKRVLRLLTN